MAAPTRANPFRSKTTSINTEGVASHNALPVLFTPHGAPLAFGMGGNMGPKEDNRKGRIGVNPDRASDHVSGWGTRPNPARHGGMGVASIVQDPWETGFFKNDRQRAEIEWDRLGGRAGSTGTEILNRESAPQLPASPWVSTSHEQLAQIEQKYAPPMSPEMENIVFPNNLPAVTRAPQGTPFQTPQNPVIPQAPALTETPTPTPVAPQIAQPWDAIPEPSAPFWSSGPMPGKTPEPQSNIFDPLKRLAGSIAGDVQNAVSSNPDPNRVPFWASRKIQKPSTLLTPYSEVASN